MDWGDVLYYCGKNGLLQIMGTLLWWGEAAHKSSPVDLHDWKQAVLDVTWSVESIMYEAARINKKRKIPPKTSSSTKSSKRSKS